MFKESLNNMMLIGITILTLASCSGTLKSFKEQMLDDMYPILTEEQYDSLRIMTTDEEIKEFIEKFWNETDLVSEFKKGELKEIYLERLDYANYHYPDQRGWGRSDMKRVYIVYGPPSSIEREIFIEDQFGKFSTIKSLEIWLYNDSGKNNSLSTRVDELYQGQMKFVFGDVTGTGYYKLLYSSEDSGDIDIRMLYKNW